MVQITGAGQSDIPNQYIFFCSDAKEKLKNTKALEYIQKGETTEVSVRGLGITVIGYHNKERIKKAKRPHWYDLKTEWDRKEISEVLLPRFIYKEYSILWNRAGYIPGGAIVQFLPKRNLFTQAIDTRVYLAILTSSFSEVIYRRTAQVYGGGTFNLRISTYKDAPMIDVTQLTVEQREQLVKAYDLYLKTKDKKQIDNLIYKILELTDVQIIEITALLNDLRELAISAKKAADIGQI